MAFIKRIPYDLLLKIVGRVNPAKLLKEYVFCKLNIYFERAQKSIYSATQKYIDIGDHDKQKVFYNMYYLTTKIFSASIANIYIGEVSIISIYCIFFFNLFHFEKNNIEIKIF
jgi:hypothetical protein